MAPSDLEQGFADVNGTRLYYELAGSGPAVVLIHGFSLDTRMWDDQFEPLARHYRVLRYDLRGFGKSALPQAESYYHHEDLRSLLDHLGIDGAALVGLSLGGAIALEFALAYPEIAAALVLADSVLWGFSWSQDEYAIGHIWRAGKEEGVEAARRLWLAHHFFAPALANPHSADRLRHIISAYSGWGWTQPDPGLIPDPPAATRLHDIHAPTLIVVGERDVPDIHRIAAILERDTPNATLAVLPGAGHMANMEAPGQFNNLLLGFLSAPPQGARPESFLETAPELRLEGPVDWAEKPEERLYGEPDKRDE